MRNFIEKGSLMLTRADPGSLESMPDLHIYSESRDNVSRESH